jgi:hypothetical protein
VGVGGEVVGLAGLVVGVEDEVEAVGFLFLGSERVCKWTLD